MQFQPELKVLTDEQVYSIHQAALEILWNTGVLVKAPAARVLLRQAGAVVDDQTMRSNARHRPLPYMPATPNMTYMFPPGPCTTNR